MPKKSQPQPKMNTTPQNEDSRRVSYFDRVPRTGAEEARYSRWLMAPAWSTRRRAK